jgi:RNA polymerase sigma factor (sigma-70 family)
MKPERAQVVMRHVQSILASSDTDALSDRELLCRFAEHGEAAAFAAVVRRHGPMVLRVCQRVLANPHDADDAFQAAFIVLARKAGARTWQASVGSWLHLIAYRLALKIKVAAARRSFHERRAEVRTPADPLAAVTGRELCAVVDAELSRWPEWLRAPLVLCCLEGRTRDEAARQLGWSVATVKRRLEQGRTRLRERLRARGFTVPAALAGLLAAEGSAPAVVPPALVHRVIETATGASTSVRVASLAAEVMRGQLWGQIKTAVAVVFVLGAAVGMGIRLTWTSSQRSGEDGPAPPAAATLQAPRSAVRADLYGDPLPAEAVARLGTVRFRHGGMIKSLAFTPDGKQLLSHGVDGVRIWDVATRREMRTITADSDARISYASLSPDGRWVATCEIPRGGLPLRQGPFRIWERASGKLVRELGKGYWTMLQFTPDGRFLAGVAAAPNPDPGIVELWDLKTGSQLRSWKPHEGPIWTIGFIRDGKTLMSAGMDKTVRFWDVATGRKAGEITGLVSRPGSLALAPDGKVLAAIRQKESPPNVVGGERPEPRIVLWDVAAGKEVRQVNAPVRPDSNGVVQGFWNIAFSPDGQFLAAGGADKFVWLWELSGQEEPRRLSMESYRAEVLAFAPDGRTLAVATPSKVIDLIDLASGKRQTPGKTPETWVASAALTPDALTLITNGDPSAILVWDPRTGRELRRLEGHTDFVLSVCLTGDGRTLFSCAGDKTVRTWNLSTGKEQRRLPVGGLGKWVGLLAVSPDGQLVIINTDGGSVRLLSAITGTEVTTPEKLPARVRGATFSADGRLLVFWSTEGRAHLWDATTLKQVRTIAFQQTPPDPRLPMRVGPSGQTFVDYAGAIAPQGGFIAFGHNRTLILHDMQSGKEMRRIEDLPDSALTVSFSPDSRMLACAGELDSAVHLVEVASGLERHRLSGHNGRVRSLTFSTDGTRLVSGSEDTTALIWDLTGKLGAPVRWAASLTAEELETSWADLAGADAGRAYQVIQRLALTPAQAVGLLRPRLQPVPRADEKRVARLIADLDSDQFAVRNEAEKELDKLGEAAKEVCRKALDGKSSPELRRRLERLLEKQERETWYPSPQRLRLLRALEILERAGTPEARRTLEIVAKGSPAAQLSQEAKASFDRLSRR